MSGALRQLAFLALAAALSWWLFLSAPEPAAHEPGTEPLDPRVLPVAAPPPRNEARIEAPVEARAELPREIDEASEVPAAAGPERGAPDGDDDGTRGPDDPGPAARADATRSSHELARDPELAAAARAELSGELRRGFDTVLLASPEEQLEIARAFGEELVLVPCSALDPDGAPHYFRLDLRGLPAVERVAARPPLELRRYRDLFDYEYARLPEALRTLRRSVLARSEVYVFAALIPLSEWAVVVGRRREALDAGGLGPDDVRRFDLRYIRTADGGFDLLVETLVLADGRSVSLHGGPPLQRPTLQGKDP